MARISPKLRYGIFSVLLLCLAASSWAQEAAKPVGWQLAVIFQRSNGKRAYVGSVKHPVLPANLQQYTERASFLLAKTKRTSLPAALPLDYEIWLTSNGKTTVLGYSLQRKQAVVPGEASARELTQEDKQALGRLLKQARPPVSPKNYRSRVNGSYPSPHPLLRPMVKEADFILVGRVAGVLREAPTPINYPTSSLRHTVFVVAVEAYLKSLLADPPAIMKIRQVGGWYTRTPGDPLLHPGERYLLFIRARSLGLEGIDDRKLGYVAATVDGVTGMGSALDEVTLLHPFNSQILLRDGMTLAAEETDIEPHWKFLDGPQIIDLPQKEAFANILNLLR